MIENKWDKYFYSIAWETSKLSYANRLKVGAVLVKNNRIILCGYNGTPEGYDNECEDQYGKTKDIVLHAEQNIITHAAKQGIPLYKTTLYITHSPCIICAKLILSSGIEQVCYDNEYRDLSGVIFLNEMNIPCIHRGENDETRATKNI